MYGVRILRKLTGTPYIAYAHREDVTIFGNDANHRQRLPTIFNGADAVIANSDFTCGELVKVGVQPERIAKISPGVDATIFCPGAADEDLLARFDLTEKFGLLSVGPLTNRKGHDYVLRALPEVLRHCPGVVYVIVSNGDEQDSLKALTSELGLEAAVRFVGEVPYDQLPDFFRLADVFILANRTLSTRDVVALYDKIRSDPRQFLSRLFEFLGADSAFVPHSTGERYNQISYPRLQATIERAALQAFKDSRVGRWTKRAHATQTVEAHDPQDGDEIITTVKQKFREDLIRLQNIIGQDLSSWTKLNEPTSVAVRCCASR
jgi:hypothetical protein